MLRTLKKIQQKFFYSFVGLWIVLKEEKSILAYLFIYSILIGLGIWLELSTSSWAIVSIIMFTSIAIEVLNTALEAAVDAISFQYNVKVKKIKDIAAAGTLVISVGMITGLLLIYIPAIQGVM